MSYILVTVYDHDISSNQFDTFDEAYNQMIEELRCEFFDGATFEPNEDIENEWKHVLDYGSKGYEDYFAFGDDWAYSNIFDSYRLDWKIIEVK